MDILNDKVFLRLKHWEQMLADILGRNYEEACGLVAGIEQTSCAVYPVTNDLHSPVRYRMDPEQQLKYLIQIEDEDQQLLAIYHSHLQGPEEPSAIDIAEAFYPGVIYLIWSNTSGEWDCQGFLIEQGLVKPVSIIRLEEHSSGI